MKRLTKAGLTVAIAGLVLLLKGSSPLVTSAIAQNQNNPQQRAEESTRDAPPDTTPYRRPAVREDFAPKGIRPIPLLPSVFIVEAVVVVVEELLVVSGSNVRELTVAVLLITVPSATEQLTLATKVMVSDWPDARDANVTIWLLPEPPQTPPPVEEHETKVVSAGRLSVTVTEVAVSGPLLVTVTV